MNSTLHTSLSYPNAPQSWLESCLEILLPTACLVCERPVRNVLVCYRCRPTLPDSCSIRQNRCPRCFTPTGGSASSGELCEPCSLYPPIFHSIRFLWDYDGLARDLIRAMKYRPSISLARLAGVLMSDAIPHLFSTRTWDIVIPTPSSPANFRRRLFHPCTELARTISRDYRVPFRDLLDNRTNRAPQATLGHSSRLRNLKNLYSVRNSHHVRHKNILLIEDVITTGATTAAVCHQLQLRGAARTDVFALARTPVWTRFRERLHRLMQ